MSSLPSSLLFLSIFIFAIFLLLGSVSPLSCFTDYCPSDNSTLCLTICPPSHNYCFRNTTFPPSIRIPGARLGCSEVDCNIPCDYEEYEDTDGEGEYCCCSGDYCNDDSKLGNLMKPKFEYRMPPLDEWPPLLRKLEREGGIITDIELVFVIIICFSINLSCVIMCVM